MDKLKHSNSAPKDFPVYLQIAKLEKALNFNLIGDALNLTDGYSIPTERENQYLSELSPGEEVHLSDCPALVDGYTPRKKKGPKKKFDGNK